MNIKKQISRFAMLFTIAAVLFSCSEDDKKEVTRLDAISVMVANDANFSILNAALKKTGLDVTLTNPGSFTVFAPTNAAFTAANITEASINALVAPADNTAITALRVKLLNHVVNVGIRADDLLAAKYVKTFAPSQPLASSLISMFVNQVGTDVLINGGAANNGAKVTQANIQLSNGIVHVIDRVLALPTLADQLNANPEFAIMATVLNTPEQAAVKAVITNATGAAPRTIMVPNGAALATATATTGTIGFLVGLSNANVTKVLQYHILTANNLRTFFTENKTIATTLVGQSFKSFTSNPLGLRIEDNAVMPRTKVSKMLTTDIQTSNGVLHIVDKVLEPTL